MNFFLNVQQKTLRHNNLILKRLATFEITFSHRCFFRVSTNCKFCEADKNVTPAEVSAK